MSWLLKLDKALAGQPEQILTLILIGLGLFAFGIATFGTPIQKAAVAAWFILP